MYDHVTDSVLNAIYSPNDRLGVELMGANQWNALKRIISAKTVKKLNERNGGNRSRFLNNVVRATNAARSNDYSAAGMMKRARRSQVMNDPLCAELWGVNEEFSNELLGDNVFSDLWRGTKKITHKVLEAGENIPVADAAVNRFREITGIFKTGSSAADTAQTVYENRGKIILIGGLGAFGLYLLLRKKK